VRYVQRFEGLRIKNGFLNPEDWNYRLSRNVGKKSPLLAA
jgi:hypothetical protein